MVKSDRKDHKRFVPISSSSLPFAELVLTFVSIPEQKNNLLTVTSETRKYFILIVTRIYNMSRG